MPTLPERLATIDKAPHLLPPWRSPAAREPDEEGPGWARSHTVALYGALDIASAPALRVHLLGVLDQGAPLLIVDLAEVSFCDAAGLSVLINARSLATQLDIAFSLVRPRPQFTRLLHVTGLDQCFDVRSTP